jgi:hypothetical protein
MHPPACAPANTERGGGSLGRPRPALPPAAPCPCRVAVGRSLGPTRHAAWMPPPTRPTLGAGTSATGGARDPRTAGRSGPSRAPGPPMVGGRRRRSSVPVVRRRRRGGGEPTRPPPLARRPSKGRRDGPERVVRWRCRSRPGPARAPGGGPRGLARGGPWGPCRRQRWAALGRSGWPRCGGASRWPHARGGPGRSLPGGATCALGGVEGRPAAPAGPQDRGLLLLPPLEDRREGVLERPGQAGGQTDWGADPATAGRDAGRQGAPGGAWGAERGELGAVLEEARALACGSGGGSGGPARGQRFTGPGHGERLDGQAPEAIIVAQRGHARPVREVQAHSAGVAVEARASSLAPGMTLCRPLGKAQQLPWCGASGLAAALGLRRSPVEATKGRQGVGGLWLHG